jgi:phosphoribosylanthranilate isomerase
MVKVKVCGIQRLEDANEAVRLGADLLGFNLYSRSPRYVEPARVVSITDQLPPHVCAVGLFVNEEKRHVQELARLCRFEVLQFHGDEDDQFLQGWREKLIKVVRMKDAASKWEVERNLQRADWVLVDAITEGYGGGGKRFSWEWLEGVSGERLFLAGGLNPKNVAEAVRTFRPYAVDVASGVEVRPGVKDWWKLGEFIENAKSA